MKPYPSSRARFRLVCDSVGLSPVYSIVAWFLKWDAGQGEEKKVAMYKRRRIALLRSLIHIVPVAAAIVLIVLNTTSFYIGGELEGPEDLDTEKLAALQFTAKLHELFMMLSLGSILVTYIRRELIFGRGVPFGALFSPSQFPNLSYVWSPAMWGIMTHDWGSRKKWFIVPLILLCTVLGFAVGPSSATLMRPRLDDWSMRYVPFWVDRSLDDLYPTTMNDSADISHCMADTGDPACPAGNWQTLNELHFSYWRWFVPRGTLPDYVHLSSRYSQRVLHTKSRAPPDEPRLLFSDAYTLCTAPLAPVGDAAAEVLRLWRIASYMATTRLRRNLDVSLSVDTKQPIVFARCNTWDEAGSGVQVPIMSSIRKVVGLKEAADEVKSLEYNDAFPGYASFTDELESTLGTTDGAGSAPSVHWIGDPVLLEAVNASISAVVAIPRYANASAQFYGCSISAVLADSVASSRIGYIKLVNGSPKSEFLNEGIFDPAHQPITIDPAWARYLNPSGPATNSTALEEILASAGLWGMEGPVTPGYREIVVESVLATLVANGIARSNYGAGIRWDLLKDPVDPSDLESGGAWADGLMREGRPFDDPADPAGSALFIGVLRVRGYAYTWRGKVSMITTVVLGVYIVVAVTHVVYSVGTGWSSASWGSPPDVVALALNSASSDAFRNTGTGIRTTGVHKERVAVGAVDGNLEMIFGDAERDRREVPVVNEEYG